MRADDDPQVAVWVLNQFLRLGFSVVQAEVLVANRVDYHHVESLLTLNPDLAWVYDQVSP